MPTSDATSAIRKVMEERLGGGGILLVAYRGDW